MENNKSVFTPLFKEKDENNQFVFQNNEWIKSNEDTINSLWATWVCSEKSHKQYEGEFIIFGYLEKTEDI